MTTALASGNVINFFFLVSKLGSWYRYIIWQPSLAKIPKLMKTHNIYLKKNICWEKFQINLKFWISWASWNHGFNFVPMSSLPFWKDFHPKEEGRLLHMSFCSKIPVIIIKQSLLSLKYHGGSWMSTTYLLCGFGGIMHGCQKVLENITSGYGNHEKKYWIYHEWLKATSDKFNTFTSDYHNHK